MEYNKLKQGFKKILKSQRVVKSQNDTELKDIKNEIEPDEHEFVSGLGWIPDVEFIDVKDSPREE